MNYSIMDRIAYSQKYLKLCTLAIVLCAVNGLSAQQNVLPIDLSTILKISGAQNATIKQVELMGKLAEADMEKAKEWWLPDLYAGGAIDQRWGATMNGNGLFFTDVSNKNFWGGLGLNLHWDLAEGIYGTSAAKLKSEASNHLTDAQRNEVLLSAIETYYEFLYAELIQDSFDELISIGDTLTAQMAVHVDAGLLVESDLLIALSNQNRLKTQLIDAQMSAHAAEAKLIQILRLPHTTKLQCVDRLLAPIDMPQTTLDSAFATRPEFLAAELMIEAAERNRVSQTKGVLLPEIKLGTFTSEFGDVFSPLYTTTGLNVNLMWNIPLGHFIYGGDLKRKETELLLAENVKVQIRDQIAQEERTASASIASSQLQMSLTKEAVDYAQKALSQARQRQELGIVIPYEMQQIHESFLRSRLDYLKSVSRFNVNSYRLFVANGGIL